MVGGVLEILGLIALLAGVCELIAWLFPRRLIDEMQEIQGDHERPRPEPEVDALRSRGAL